MILDQAEGKLGHIKRWSADLKGLSECVASLAEKVLQSIGSSITFIKKEQTL